VVQDNVQKLVCVKAAKSLKYDYVRFELVRAMTMKFTDYQLVNRTVLWG
jgi:hypothetical protein